MKDLFVSVSGGRTSGYLALKVRDIWPDRKMHFVFANTGQEMEQTLIFVDKLDKYYGLDIVWLESDVHAGRNGTTHKIVSFETASRDGKPFIDVCKKYGIPNQNYLHCTRELKQQPIKSYVRSLDYKRHDYEMAIGIRADEQKRVNLVEAAKHNAVYPLIEQGIDKSDVNEFWERAPFNLELKEHQGNCKWCYKKSDKKHAMLHKEMPDIYEFPRMVERECANGDGRKIFRGKRSTDEYIAFVSLLYATQQPERKDENSGCSESCEAFGSGI